MSRTDLQIHITHRDYHSIMSFPSLMTSAWLAPFYHSYWALYFTLVYYHFAAETLVGLRDDLRNAMDLLTKIDNGLVTSITSGCELFLRFITLTALDNPVRMAKSKIHEWKFSGHDLTYSHLKFSTLIPKINANPLWKQKNVICCKHCGRGQKLLAIIILKIIGHIIVALQVWMYSTYY